MCFNRPQCLTLRSVNVKRLKINLSIYTGLDMQLSPWSVVCKAEQCFSLIPQSYEPAVFGMSFVLRNEHYLSNQFYSAFNSNAG